MTKEQYLEMCVALGTTPDPEEIPVEYSDFPTEIQEVLEVYATLQDNWDTFNGNYLGKNLSNIVDIFDILNIEDTNRVFTLQMIGFIDRIRMDQIVERRKQEESLKEQQKAR